MHTYSILGKGRLQPAYVTARVCKHVAADVDMLHLKQSYSNVCFFPFQKAAEQMKSQKH